MQTAKVRTHRASKKLLGYVTKEKKTKLEDRRFVSGVNCSPESAFEEMQLTKQANGKTDGRLYYHLVQSFPKGYEISPELAHQIALEFTEKAFKDYECVVATHIDREHIHIRFHDLRHSTASFMLANGFSMKDIQEYLGHANFNFTADVYTHTDMQAKREMINSITAGLQTA